MQRFTVDSLTVEIVPDPAPINPRRISDNLGRLWLLGPYAAYGDPDAGHAFGFDPEECPSWAEIEARMRAEHRGLVLLPVYVYDHSGLRFSTEPWGCPWDSGRVGTIYALPADLRAEYGRLSPAVRAQAATVLAAEIAALDQYASGDVWGYRILDADGAELEAVWGFFGDDTALADALDAAHAIAAERRAAA